MSAHISSPQDGFPCIVIDRIPCRPSKSPASIPNARKVPVNLTWIVLFAMSICTLSLLFDELFFSHDHIWSYLPSRGYGAKVGATDNVLSLLSSREHHALARRAAVFAFFVIVSIWAVSAYIKIAYLKNTF